MVGEALWSKEVKIPIFGLGTGAGVPGGSVGMKNVSKGLSEEFGTAGEVASIILPKTYGETAVLTAAPFAYKALPPVGKIITSTYLGVTGTKTVLDPTATKPERIIGGTVGVLGFTGAAFEATPFR